MDIEYKFHNCDHKCSQPICGQPDLDVMNIAKNNGIETQTNELATHHDGDNHCNNIG